MNEFVIVRLPPLTADVFKSLFIFRQNDLHSPYRSRCLRPLATSQSSSAQWGFDTCSWQFIYSARLNLITFALNIWPWKCRRLTKKSELQIHKTVFYAVLCLSKFKCSLFCYFWPKSFVRQFIRDLMTHLHYSFQLDLSLSVKSTLWRGWLPAVF